MIFSMGSDIKSMQMTLGASRFTSSHLPPTTNCQRTTRVIVPDKIQRSTEYG
jgi:hypothetical protein